MTHQPDASRASSRSSPLMQRADARRNRARLLEAAHELFLERGMMLQIDEVARRAGIGMGTLYRNFPSKDDLIAAIVLQSIEASRADLLRVERSESPWQAFAAAVKVIAAHTLGTTPHSQLASLDAARRDDVYDAIVDLMGIFTEFADRAREAGELRADISAQEIMELVVRAVLPRTAHAESSRLFLPEGFSERVLLVVLDGLRT